MTNDDMTTIIDTSDEWIRSRSGIEERRVSHVPGSDLAAVAGHRALAAAGAKPEEIDLLIVATCTPDTVIPSEAAHVQKKMGAKNAAVFDLNAGCSGFLYSLSVATAMIRSAGYSKVLVIGSERITWFLNWSLRDTAVLFGDGAGALVLEPSELETGLLTSHLGCDGEVLEALMIPNFGTAGNRFVDDYHKFDVQFDGREIFRRAVKGMAMEVRKVLGDLRMQNADIDLIIPHQANKRILDGTARKIGLAPEKIVITVAQHANTSAASIPLALNTALEDGRIKEGHLVLMEAMGGGFTWGGVLVRW